MKQVGDSTDEDKVAPIHAGAQWTVQKVAHAHAGG
jgi:hypothetical protein